MLYAAHFRFAVLLIALLSPTPLTAASSDDYYLTLNRQLLARGLPAVSPVTGDTEDDALDGFRLVYLSGAASKDMVAYKGLPFRQTLKLLSQTAPDQTWQHFIQRPAGSRFAPGDIGLLVFSIRAGSDTVAPVTASLKGADDSYPVLLSADVTPQKNWQTVYLPFRTPTDLIQKTTNLAFFFGGARQTIEIGGVALYDYGRQVTLAELRTAVAGLPTAIDSVGTVSPTQFPFFTPWDDAAKTFLDVSFLNNGPAGSHGFIVVKNGHFAESVTGKRVRFLGVNMGLNGSFPAHADAEKVAAHLAKYGINLVRMHDIDVTWAGGHYTVWDETHYRDHRHMDPGQVDKLDYLIAQLEKNGIYIDMCLHMGRTFIPEDGFPDSVKGLGGMDKRVDEFDRQMITVNKEYAHQLLTHVNPYTKLPYSQDPGLLDVEINNEDSLVAYSFSDQIGSGLASLPGPYRRELQGLWNDWLLKKYGRRERLAAAWKSAADMHGPNLYPVSLDPARWTLEQQPGTDAALASDGDALRVDIRKVDGTDWHVQLYQKGLGLLETGKKYVISFEAKADAPRNVGIGARLDHPNFDFLGLSGAAGLTAAWQTFTYSFQAVNAQPGHNRLPNLVLGTQTGPVWLRNITLREGVGAFVLPPGQSPGAKTVPVEPSGQRRPRADWLEFLADTETAYAREMRAYLRHDLGVRQNIRVSQVGFGGLYGTYRESASDFVDNHSYWAYHDNFPDPFDPQPLFPSLGKSDPLTIGDAMNRVAGKPYTLSEINQCFPSATRAEMVPEYAAFAAFQDWDALTFYTYSDYGADAVAFGSLDRISTTFDVDKDPAVWGFLPFAALTFRAGLIPLAPASMTLALPAAYPSAQVAAGVSLSDFWKRQGIAPAAALTHRLAVRLGGVTEQDPPAPVGAAPTLRVWADDPQTARSMVDAPSVKAVTGYIGGQTVHWTGLSVAFGALANRFGAMTLVSLDQKPLAQSARVLMTFVTQTQNSGQQLNLDGTVLTNAGGGPVLVNSANAAVTLTSDGPRTVYTLDSTGACQELLPSAYKNGLLSFSVTPDQHTIWFAIEAK